MVWVTLLLAILAAGADDVNRRLFVGAHISAEDDGAAVKNDGEIAFGAELGIERALARRQRDGLAGGDRYNDARLAQRQRDFGGAAGAHARVGHLVRTENLLRLHLGSRRGRGGGRSDVRRIGNHFLTLWMLLKHTNGAVATIPIAPRRLRRLLDEAPLHLKMWLP